MDAATIGEALTPWTGVLERAGARYSVSVQRDDSSVVSVHVDVVRFLRTEPFGGDESESDNGILKLREAIELVHLAIAVDPRVLDELVTRRALFPPFPRERVGVPMSVRVVLHCERRTTEGLHSIVFSFLAPHQRLTVSDAFQRVRRQLQQHAQLTTPIEAQLEVAPPPPRSEHRPFFHDLVAVATHLLSTSSAAASVVTDASLADFSIINIQLLVGGLRLNKTLLAAVQKLSKLRKGFVQCKLLSIGVHDVQCPEEELANYLRLLLEHSPDAAVRLVPTISLLSTVDAPLRKLKLFPTRYLLDKTNTTALRRACASLSRPKRPIGKLSIDCEGVDDLNDMIALVGVLGSVKELEFQAFVERFDGTRLASIFDLHPTLEMLSLSTLSLDSLDFLVHHFGATSRLCLHMIGIP